MSALARWLRKLLGARPRPDFATRLDRALANHDAITLRVRAWERSLAESALDLEPHNDGRNA